MGILLERIRDEEKATPSLPVIFQASQAWNISHQGSSIFFKIGPPNQSGARQDGIYRFDLKSCYQKSHSSFIHTKVTLFMIRKTEEFYFPDFISNEHCKYDQMTVVLCTLDGLSFSIPLPSNPSFFIIIELYSFFIIIVNKVLLLLLLNYTAFS